jgi:TonB family protein
MENAMKCILIILAAAGFAISVPPGALAREIKVIANSSVRTEEISAEDLKRVFLEETRWFGDGFHAEPVIEKDGPVHEAFLQEYIGKSSDDLQTFYRALIFTGRGFKPKELASDAEVVAYVARTKGAIGYVGYETYAGGVRTLAVIPAGNGAERKLITRVEPEYPETLKRLNIGGTVRLQVTISPKGYVEDVHLLGGNPILGDAATSAIKRWVYTSAHSRSTAEITIPFDPHR